MKYKVTKGNKIRNVKDGDMIKTYYEGDVLPEDYAPPESYIKQKLVIEIKKTKKEVGGDK